MQKARKMLSNWEAPYIQPIMYEQLISMVPGVNSDKIKTFSAAMRAIFLPMLHKHENGEEVFENALRLMFRGVVKQMLQEGSE